MKSRYLSMLLIALFTLALGLALVGAQDEEATARLEYRQRLMKGHGAAMGSIGDILKYKLPYGAAHIQKHAQNIHEFASMIPDAFKENVDGTRQDAQPAVWTDWDDFVAKADALGKASGELADAASGGDLRAAMPKVKAVGDACRGCHSTYRKPEEERFKR